MAINFNHPEEDISTSDGKAPTLGGSSILTEESFLLGKDISLPAEPLVGDVISAAMLAAGAIVEMGWNANGIYVRWESGLQICVSYRPTGPWTYPARFGAERPFVFGTPIDGGNLGMIAGVGSSAEPPTSTATTVTIRDTNPPAVRYDHSGNWVAIGLWK